MTLSRYSTRYGSALFFLIGVAISSIKLVRGQNGTSSPVPTRTANVSWTYRHSTVADDGGNYNKSIGVNGTGAVGNNATANNITQSKNKPTDDSYDLEYRLEYEYYPFYEEDIRVIFPKFFHSIRKRRSQRRDYKQHLVDREKINVEKQNQQQPLLTKTEN
ncbi:protein E4A [Proboscivirus elephantidbeta4]|uniref:Protein E4A n=1 Tax=Elephant endotheliotropic herpesvirus 4 TaxID=548914 RepID=A0A0S1TPW3_9BETA|nr:protein E4A [Elephant endotheliotropic herpesvirus 4]ALM26042.1 protein E4A [Elephant endotheliotropic herpesvirus 4]